MVFAINNLKANNNYTLSIDLLLIDYSQTTKYVDNLKKELYYVSLRNKIGFTA